MFAAAAVNAATLTLTILKNGQAWQNHAKTFTLKDGVNPNPVETGNKIGNQVVFSNYSPGYTLWDGNTQVQTTGGAAMTLNYYPVLYGITNNHYSTSTISATYDGYPVNSGDIVLGGSDLNININQLGIGHSYNTTCTNKGAPMFGSTSIQVSDSANIQCTVNGTRTRGLALFIKKDDAAWRNHGKTFTLWKNGVQQPYNSTEYDNGRIVIFDDNFSGANYRLYDGGKYTYVDSTEINNAQLKELNYYEVGYNVVNTVVPDVKFTISAVNRRDDDSHVDSGAVLLSTMSPVRISVIPEDSANYDYFWTIGGRQGNSSIYYADITPGMETRTNVCTVDAPPTFNYTINLRRDGAFWQSHGKTFTLRYKGVIRHTSVSSGYKAEFLNVFEIGVDYELWDGNTKTNYFVSSYSPNNLTLDYFTFSYTIDNTNAAPHTFSIAASDTLTGSTIASGATILSNSPVSIKVTSDGGCLYEYKTYQGTHLLSADTLSAVNVEVLRSALSFSNAIVFNVKVKTIYGAMGCVESVPPPDPPDPGADPDPTPDPDTDIPVDPPIVPPSPDDTLSSNTAVVSVVMHTATQRARDTFLLDCGAPDPVEVRVTTEDRNAVVLYDGIQGNVFMAPLRRADIHTVEYIVRAANGTEKQYSFVVERRFLWRDIVMQLFDNILYINNNAERNGGYTFTDYQWYKDGELVDTGQYYIAGKRGEIVNVNEKYTASMHTNDGKALSVCWGYLEKTAGTTAESITPYPNPVQKGGTIKLLCPHGYFDEQPSKQARIVNSSGSVVMIQTITADNTEIEMPSLTGSYMVVIDNDIAKIVVK
jgi:hypothetical protein